MPWLKNFFKRKSDNMEDLVLGMKSQDKAVKEKALETLHKKLISPEENSAVAAAIISSKEAVSYLVSCLTSESESPARRSAIKVIGIIAELTSDREIISSGLLPALIKILDFEEKPFLAAALVRLGKVLSEMSVTAKLPLLQVGILPALIKIIMTTDLYQESDILNQASRTLYFFTQPHPKPFTLTLPKDAFKSLLPVIAFLLEKRDEWIISVALEILKFISVSVENSTREVLEAGMIPKIVSFMGHEKAQLRDISAIMILAIVICRQPLEIKAVLDAGALQNLSFALDKSTSGNKFFLVLEELVKRGSVNSKQIRDAGLFPFVIKEVHKADPETMRSSSSTMINLVPNKETITAEFANYLVQQGVVQCLMGIVKRENSEFVEAGKKALVMIVLSTKDEFKMTAFSILNEDNDLCHNLLPMIFAANASCT